MLVVPGLAPVDEDLVDGSVLDRRAATVDWDGQPLNPLMGLDAVAIAPTVLVVLDIIIKDENVSLIDLVEIAAPGDVRGL